jgi:hypothetical protein
LTERFCVFCGEKPESKNREHVIPAWLIALTGDKNREVGLGIDFTKDTFGEKRFSFNSFTFPACESCNSSFAELESAAKSVVETVLARGPLAASDWALFLDWLDKVRVGLWLGGIYLNENVQGVEPLFHIQRRVGSSDRLVVIYEFEPDGWQGVVWVGTDSPVFQVMPSAFAIAINGFGFVSVSQDFLLAERLGLPYPVSRRLMDDQRQLVDMTAGTEFVRFPVFDFKFPFGGRQICQPMLPWRIMTPDLGDESHRFYDTDYVRSLSADHEAGHGRLLTQTRKGLARYPDAPSLDWLPPVQVPRQRAFFACAAAVFAVLDQLYSTQPSFGELSAARRDGLEKLIPLRLKANGVLMDSANRARRNSK